MGMADPAAFRAGDALLGAQIMWLWGALDLQLPDVAFVARVGMLPLLQQLCSSMRSPRSDPAAPPAPSRARRRRPKSFTA